MKLLGRTLIALAILAVCYGLLVRFNESGWLFQPARYPNGDWRIQSVYGAHDVRLAAADGSPLSAWWIPYPDARRTVIFFHSGRGNISEQAAHIVKLQELESNIFLPDYRGYGKSGGRPSLAGIEQDGETAYEYVTTVLKVPPSRLILQGDALGSAVAALLAARHPQVAGLVLESPFPDLRTLANHALPLGGWLMGGQLDVAGAVRSYPGPKLILFASGDRTVPPALSQQVYEDAAPPKYEHEVAGGSDASLVVYAGDGYRDWLREFYATLRLPTPQERVAPRMPMVHFGQR